MQALFERLANWASESIESLAVSATTPDFYLQVAGAAIATVVAAVVSGSIRRRLAACSAQRPNRRLNPAASLGPLVFPVLVIIFLAIAGAIANSAFPDSWFLRLAQGVAVVAFLVVLITTFVGNRFVKLLLAWVGIPVALLQVFGLLDDVTGNLDQVSITLGNISVSLLALIRTVVFGSLLFWLGGVSNNYGKQVIRTQESLAIGTRELFAKLFEIAIFVAVFLLLLPIMGINLTALAVFGGAVGIGLGFGLQQIASNFISGLIILLDRSVTIGDFIELEDGRSGKLRALNMRHGILESYDGKDVVVPNEMFITSSYTNWTHKDIRQRYSLEFQVAYSTDLDLLFSEIKKACADHPTVISGDDVPTEYRPDAEIAGFGDSGIDILVEFWMEGIDDGPNRVGADLLYAIWQLIRKNGMQIPFPQREVRILRDPEPGTEPEAG